jgi:hypothetical protein
MTPHLPFDKPISSSTKGTKIAQPPPSAPVEVISGGPRFPNAHLKIVAALTIDEFAHDMDRGIPPVASAK